MQGNHQQKGDNLHVISTESRGGFSVNANKKVGNQNNHITKFIPLAFKFQVKTLTTKMKNSVSPQKGK